jgi:hypothetical protein
MTAQPSDENESLSGDDRWIDAVLREHARLGEGSDERFMRSLDLALAGESGQPPRHRNRTIPIAIAAALAILLTGILWNGGRKGDQSDPSVTASSEVPGSGVELFTSLPPELIEGTPKRIDEPRLVGVPPAAPTLRVPEGTVLVSRGKSVSSSDDLPIIGSLSLVTDGDKDAGEGYYVELLDGLQWVQIDLEKSTDVQAIWLWHFHSQRRAYHDVIVQISDDPSFKSGVTTVYNNDYDNSAKFGKGADNPYVESRFGLLINAKGTKGRHVRLYSNGNTSNDMNHYIEVEVFGSAD